MRVLVAIGCDQYASEYLPALGGAENDAAAIFDFLVNNDSGLYDKKHSLLLNSPTVEEAKAALTQAVFDTGCEMDFCLFFAGHGSVKDGAYFLCLKDTSCDKLSVSAICLTEFFMWLNEAKIRDTNIVIDACQSGGVAHDVAVFLKPSEVGHFGSPSVSILAASAADQAAREINGQGVATSSILKCLSGEVIVQKDRPSLSLIEIGHSVAELMDANTQQSPVCWGLNLFGRSIFSSNPCFEEPKTPVIGLPEGLSRTAGEEPVIRKYATKVWELYLSSSMHFDAQKFLDLIQSLLRDLPPESTTAPVIVDALATTFQSLLINSSDPFEEVELFGASIASLLPYSFGNDVVINVINAMSEQLLKTICSGSEQILNAIENDRFSLLSDRFLLADLYYLPIRIVKILGWVGAGQFVSNVLGNDSQDDLLVRQKLVRAILDNYQCSLVAVSEEQTCNFAVFTSMAGSMELSDEAEIIFGSFFNTFHHFNGKISSANISGSDAYKFIKARAGGGEEIPEGLISNPTEFLSALLLASEKLGITDVVDNFIERFDHASANLFVPDTYTDFADDKIENGLNFTYRIGDGVWCVNDFLDTWRASRSKIEGDPSIEVSAIQIAAICAAFIKPDRTPWFVWD